MILTTTETIPGYEIERVIGFVEGSSVRTVHLGKHIRGFFRRIVGGELTYYSDLLDRARSEACKRMIEKAERLGADAIIGVRYMTAMIAAGASEITVYGTAVKLKRI
ncbi:MAG: YbjQ family protein [Nitrososphaerota archaeon]|nr:YbjQ family protein [Nitrososphaerales archaeon]MCX8191878.1 YbjQ family protein [Nitrososphaerales archaeon]MDW8044454.1 YbjQ family protein [Nitrososphaerota archaeon]